MNPMRSLRGYYNQTDTNMRRNWEDFLSDRQEKPTLTLALTLSETLTPPKLTIESRPHLRVIEAEASPIVISKLSEGALVVFSLVAILIGIKSYYQIHVLLQSQRKWCKKEGSSSLLKSV
jgi:hypothetical protein